MKQKILQLTSILLIASFAIGNISLSFLHDHEEELICEHGDDLNELDSCHIHLYHLGAEQESSCEHEAHYDVYHNDCEWCMLLPKKRSKFHLPKLQSFATDIHVKNLEFAKRANLISIEFGTKSSRAPPAVG